MAINDANRFLEWSARGIPLLLAIGILAGCALHYGLGLAWHDLGVPLLVLVAIQMVSFAAMFWGNGYFRYGDARPSLLIAWAYILTFCATAFHYAVRWGLVNPERHKSDYWQFPLAVSIAMILAALLYPVLRKL